MKKLFLTMAVCLAIATPSWSQQRFAENGLWDNWYAGVNVGFNSKLTDNRFMSHLNPHVTLRAGRDIIPLVGVMAEVTGFFNDQGFPATFIGTRGVHSHTFVKAIDFDVLGSLNLHNLFGGYPGYQRFFEARLIAGVGLNHVCGVDVKTKNDFVAKFGFDLALNLNRFARTQGFEIYLEPALNYNLTRYSSGVHFNPNCAAWQLAIGANYHFNHLNRRQKILYNEEVAPEPEVVPDVRVTKAITIVPREKENGAYGANEANGANGVNGAYETYETYEAYGANEATKPTKPQKPVQTGANGTNEPTKPAKPASPVKVKKKEEKAVVKPVVKAVAAGNASLPTVRFTGRDNIIPDNQYEALSQVASYLKNHPRAQLVIKGSSARTSAVKNALVRRFGINASRLSTASSPQTDIVTFSER